ncbi:hypothetical protein BH09BAC1_BH09BAC1_23760 [soil metagenome]
MAQMHTVVKFFCTWITVIACFTFSSAQTGAYWQQQVDYNIEVALDDNKHELQGVININYVNNSPDTLQYLYIHLWPNAYKNIHTAFAKQQVENGETDFHYSNKEDRGYIDGMDFMVNNLPTAFTLDSVNIDYGILKLNNPLMPGGKLSIKTPFHVKIPKSYSRLGHVEQSYQITQWYPKPAVYDQDGWHQMPYLDQGEFYSEFGTFDVKITLPANYVVGASGDLQTTSELAWLDSLASGAIRAWQEQTFPASSAQTKTLHYRLENAHDFAWFADKRFKVVKDVATLGNGEKVTCWALYTTTKKDTWRGGAKYVARAIEHYSKYLGNYPYKVATAVEGALSAGGGMEYPTITIIGSATNKDMLENITVHEVGHFWLYGILGSNERRYPWMDEGINSFYEDLYYQVNYPNKKLLDSAPSLSKAFDLDWARRGYQNHFLYLYSASQNKDQALGLPSEEFTGTNYGAIVYAKGAVAMQYLRGYLGDSTFDVAMHQYYETWKFKHPKPEDLRQSLESSTGKSLGWFFDGLVNTDARLDYAITKARKHPDYEQFYEIRVSNKGGLHSPFSVSALDGKDNVVRTIWYSGTASDTTVLFPTGEYESFRIDARMDMPEYNRANDTYRTHGLMRKTEPVRFQFLGALDNPYKNQLFIAPAIAWNNYDKTMVGLVLYNHLLPFQKFEYELAPMIGTASVNFTGTGRVAYSWLPKDSKLQRVTLSVGGQRFSHLLKPETLTWARLMPSLRFEFKPKTPRNINSFAINLRSVNIWQDFLYRDEVVKSRYYVNEIKGEYQRRHTLYPFAMEVGVQQANTCAVAFTEAKWKIKYMKAKESLNIRFYAGGFIFKNKDASDISPPNPVLQLSGSTGNGSDKLTMFQRDYMFDHYYLDRNGLDPVFAQQIATKDGGFRSRTIVGDTDKFLTSVTIDATAPSKIPVKLFAGLAGFVDGSNEFSFAAELGLAVVIIPDVFEINFPLLTSQNIKTNQETGLGLDKFYQKITFTLNIRQMDPLALLRNIKLF